MSMSLTSALHIANSGLTNVSTALSLVAHNVANASTTGYAVESLNQQSMTASGIGMGVRTGVATTDVNAQLAADLTAQNATVSGLQTTQTALQPISSLLGTVGQSNDLSSQLTTLQNDFTALLGNPSSTSAQQQVVVDAQSLAGSINTLSNAYTTARQGVQNNLVAAVGSLNTALGQIGTLNKQIVVAQASGGSTADLTNQMAAVEQTVSQLVGVKFVTQSNGAVLVITNSGTTLPTQGGTALSTSNATISAGSSLSAGTIPAIMMGGVDVTSQLTGGQIGANIALRDTTLPTYQAELDQFSQTLASQFSAQGLTLFSNAAGVVPALGTAPAPVQSGYVGFASQIQVNPAVLANPALVRDGTNTIAGSATGASAFTPNPTGAAGFTGMISRVLDYTFGSTVQPGVSQPASPTSGLGITGTLAAPYLAPATLGGLASTVIAAQAQDIGNSSSQLSNEQTLQTTLQGKISSQSGVNIDTEMANMVQLQNAYGANARIISTVQSIWYDLTQMGLSG